MSEHERRMRDALQPGPTAHDFARLFTDTSAGRIDGHDPVGVPKANPHHVSKPQILCFVDGEGNRDAELVEDLDELIGWIEVQWLGYAGAMDAEENQQLKADISQRPDAWGDGTGKLLIDIEPGISYVELTLLGTTGHWNDEWSWG